MQFTFYYLSQVIFFFGGLDGWMDELKPTEWAKDAPITFHIQFLHIMEPNINLHLFSLSLFLISGL